MKVHNLLSSENIKVTSSGGIFQVLQHQDDLSSHTPSEAISQYFMKQQNIHKRQIVATLNGSCGVVLQSGAMQFTAGNLQMATNVKGVGDLIGKMVSAKVTKESTIKPRYTGTGIVVTEPTYKYLFTIDVGAVGDIVIEDGMFVACEDTVALKTVAAKSLSGAVLGGEGIFNLGLFGKGTAVLESRVPYEELVCVEISNGEQLKVDGSYAVMWDNELTMTVERSSRTLLGSAVSGEGLVNVFTGTGRVWLEVSAAKGLL